jgi:hypothetical protein
MFDKEVLRALVAESQRSREVLKKSVDDLSRKADALKELIENNQFAQKILEVLKDDSRVVDPSDISTR